MEAWDRLENESSKAYEAFCRYRDMGISRSVMKVQEKYSDNYKTERLLHRWSTTFSWVNRCREFDKYMEKEMRKEFKNEYIEMNKRHAQYATLLQRKAMEQLQELDSASLKPIELMRFMETGVKLEKEAIGVPEFEEYEEDKRHQVSQKIIDEVNEINRKLLEIRDGKRNSLD